MFLLAVRYPADFRSVVSNQLLFFLLWCCFQVMFAYRLFVLSIFFDPTHSAQHLPDTFAHDCINDELTRTSQTHRTVEVASFGCFLIKVTYIPLRSVAAMRHYSLHFCVQEMARLNSNGFALIPVESPQARPMFMAGVRRSQGRLRYTIVRNATLIRYTECVGV